MFSTADEIVIFIIAMIAAGTIIVFFVGLCGWYFSGTFKTLKNMRRDSSYREEIEFGSIETSSNRNSLLSLNLPTNDSFTIEESEDNDEDNDE